MGGLGVEGGASGCGRRFPLNGVIMPPFPVQAQGEADHEEHSEDGSDQLRVLPHPAEGGDEEQGHQTNFRCLITEATMLTTTNAPPMKVRAVTAWANTGMDT